MADQTKNRHRDQAIQILAVCAVEAKEQEGGTLEERVAEVAAGLAESILERAKKVEADKQ